MYATTIYINKVKYSISAETISEIVQLGTGLMKWKSTTPIDQIIFNIHAGNRRDELDKPLDLYPGVPKFDPQLPQSVR